MEKLQALSEVVGQLADIVKIMQSTVEAEISNQAYQSNKSQQKTEKTGHATPEELEAVLKLL